MYNFEITAWTDLLLCEKQHRDTEMLITPAEQDFISKLFSSYGYEITFDEIKEETLWK